jgi:hypothetical protein
MFYSAGAESGSGAKDQETGAQRYVRVAPEIQLTINITGGSSGWVRDVSMRSGRSSTRCLRQSRYTKIPCLLASDEPAVIFRPEEDPRSSIVLT